MNTRRLRLRLALALIASMWCQANAKQPNFRPTVEVVRLNYCYGSSFDSLQFVDFRNFDYRVFEKSGKTNVILHLRGGTYQSRWTYKYGSNWGRFDWAKFIGAAQDHVVIGLSWVTTGGSSSDFGLVQVIELQERHPVVIQQLLFNTRGCIHGTGAKFSANNGLLTVTGVQGWEHCCSTKLDVITYRWNGSMFRQQTATSVPMSSSC